LRSTRSTFRFRKQFPRSHEASARVIIAVRASPVLIVCLFGARLLGAAASYDVVPAFGGLKFREPVEVVFAPGEKERAFVVERGGVIVVLRNRDHPKREVFLDLGERSRTFDHDHGTLTLAFHPQFATNGFFYVWYSVRENGRRSNRLARFHDASPDAPAADRASELPMLTQPTGPGGHDGAHLLFGTDGYLYVSLGDGDEHLSEPVATRQRIDRSFFGGVLRLDVDQRPGSLAPNAHPSVHAGTYAVPADNPFIGATQFNGQRVDPARVRTEFWAVGLRNPWRLAFDPATGRLWCGDVGLHDREEIDLIVRGGNYGWNFREGSIAGPREASAAGLKFIEPIWDYDRAAGISITGGFVYHGTNFPELEGQYLFADYAFGKIWALQPDGDKRVAADRVRQIATAASIVALTPDPRNGDPLLTSFAGQVWRLSRRR
jgi:glucose/arabinose dehydrogenase